MPMCVAACSLALSLAQSQRIGGGMGRLADAPGTCTMLGRLIGLLLAIRSPHLNELVRAMWLYEQSHRPLLFQVLSITLTSKHLLNVILSPHDMHVKAQYGA